MTQRRRADDPAVMLTGSRGFVGRAVSKLLRGSGHRVIGLDVTSRINPLLPETESRFDSAPSDHGAPEGGEADISCDIRDAAGLRRAFEAERIGAIIHLAAILPTAAQRDPLLATQVNVQGSFNLLEMARQCGVRRFVFGSSLSVYGSYSEEHVVSESDRCAPEDLYGAAKIYVEQLGQAYHEQHGLEFVSLRIGRVVGPGARSVSSAWRSEIFESLNATSPAEIRMPYVADERLLLVHVEDVAKMLIRLLEAPQLKDSIYNAPCESVVVEDLKSEVERLNPKIRVSVGDVVAAGNPRRLDASRFVQEFGFEAMPISQRLREWKKDAEPTE